ncbi:homoserine O-acetyltransferase MetX [Fuchsiella alkaliacetigena]|uniref:homoserine O-acetyltransferase MetX n=1 Tax=Fuchsiella alkaliacetigena TaxID=957042 RepID=UPI00200A7917|nr:homoserine O-acetyltransferase [Fuchsiella alkaliacetigena]MCK8823774.1 homoserine O-acetyltransferase [Fuchsiella alkaliacetigena]
MSVCSEELAKTEGDLAVVSPQKLTLFSDDKMFELESGQKLGPIEVAYESYGTLNSARDNVVLIVHHLTANAHAAGKYSLDDQEAGWWDPLIGPGKAIDTEEYYVICTNVLGSCYGSTGPASINPATGKEYGSDFPVVTVGDMVNLQKAFLEKLGIKELQLVIGGSLGGMQVLKWAVEYPDFLQKAVPISTPAQLKAQTIAYNQVAIEAVKNDPAWHGGHYYQQEERPVKGMDLARKIGMITFRTPQSFQARFGRKELADKEFYSLDNQFKINSYLDYQGQKFINRFDANSFIYLTKAMDLYDLSRGYGSLAAALERVEAEVMMMAVDSDQLFPIEESREVVSILKELDKDVKFHQLRSDYGHDAFLVEFHKFGPVIEDFLSS